MPQFSDLMQKSDGKDHEAAFRAVMTKAPSTHNMFSEEVVQDFDISGVISWTTLGSTVANNPKLQEIDASQQVSHLVDVLHYHVPDVYDYPYVIFSRGHVGLVRINNCSPRKNLHVGLCVDVDEYCFRLKNQISDKSHWCRLL
jgi:hypothetical protein